MSTSTLSRRLPGIRFEIQTPPLVEVLPRMDIAVFVGFAASGPLHIPVAIEDDVQFREIFGDDAPLAWDVEKGEQVYAYLAPAVRSFFRNGGSRCWVIRVADEEKAKYNYFPIPGLAMAEFDNGDLKKIRPAFARARSQGRWSDALQVGTVLSGQPLAVEHFSYNKDLSIDCFIPKATKILKGDLLRLSFVEEGCILMFYVGSVDLTSRSQSTSPPGTALLHIRISPERVLWLRTSLFDSPPLFPKEVHRFTHDSKIPLPIVSKPLEQKDTKIKVYLNLPLKAAPPPGSIILVDCETGQMWLTIQETLADEVAGSPPNEITSVKGEGLWWLKEEPIPKPESIPKVERLTFDLLARWQKEHSIRMQNVAFSKSHLRFWGALPTDQELFKECGTLRLTEYQELRREASDPRFPLAGVSKKANISDLCFTIATGEKQVDAYYFPIGMQIIPEYFLKAEKQVDDPIIRDGLSEFGEDLFLDSDLKDIGTEHLMLDADFLRYQSPVPRSLKGIYAALDIDEATIIAVPDAIHRGWEPKEPDEQPISEESSPPFRPEWWHHLECNLLPQELKKRSEELRVHIPCFENFLDCNIRAIPPDPKLFKEDPDEIGTFTLSWSFVPDAKYILEEATSPDWTGAATVYTGSENSLKIYGYPQGDYYFRVCAEVNNIKSNWSNGVTVRVLPSKRWQLKKTNEYSSDTLLAIHRSLLRMCAARGDLFVVFSLPEHYREDDMTKYIRTLKLTPEKISNIAEVKPLGLGELSNFSYAAVYHPWLIVRKEDTKGVFRHIPPDGTACGIMADRTLNRGAWIAPANELFRGIVALTPSILQEKRLSLQEAQINLIRQEPRGFVTLSADTLSDDPDLRPINVRRLLILLRRLALRLGARYVFEPNNDSFRRMVERGFEAMLDDLFVRGAFGGKTPETSYQVVTSTLLNTPQSIEQGRFIVELKVAPSLPMTFLKIRLVQTGDRLSVSEGK